MKQQLVELERIHFSRAFPWVHLFRAFRIALDVRKMLLGAVALLVFTVGLYGISYLPLDLTESETATLRQPIWNLSTAPSPVSFAAQVLSLIAQPILVLLAPAWQLVREPMSWSGAAMRWSQIVWGLCTWSFFGVAISRMGAVQFAVDERVSLKNAVKFAGQKFLWSMSAPLMPLGGILGFCFLCVLAGWIGKIPGAGPIVIGVLWLIPLLLAFVMLLLIIGLIFGWPLMIATISTQGSDAFDGFSRSFDYVYSRFWHLLWFLVLAAGYGILAMTIVAGAALGVQLLASHFVAVGMGAEGFSALFTNPPDWLQTGFEGTAANDPSIANRIASAWMTGLTLFVLGYAVSYFWTTMTIIYFLLRQSEDANHLSEVHLPQTKETDDLVQLAGVAASDQPIIERPAKHDEESRNSAGETGTLDTKE